jgi:hypothetical protein
MMFIQLHKENIPMVEIEISAQRSMILIGDFRDFPQSLQTNAGTVP